MSPEASPFASDHATRAGCPRDSLRPCKPSRRSRSAARHLLWVAAVLAGQTASSADSHPEAVVQSLLTVPVEKSDHRELEMITVEYPPGGSSKPHRHNAYVLVYVLAGELDMQLTDQPLVHLRAGQTFLERPSDVHEVSRNASQTEPAKFLVVMLKKAPTTAPPAVPQP
jgi:quercetin dioxygenase-like cupin family protein